MRGVGVDDVSFGRVPPPNAAGRARARTLKRNTPARDGDGDRCSAVGLQRVQQLHERDLLGVGLTAGARARERERGSDARRQKKRRREGASPRDDPAPPPRRHLTSLASCEATAT